MTGIRRCQGSSLLEAILVTAMFFAALGLISTLFAYGSRFARAGTERSDLGGTRLNVATRLRKAMAGSYQSGNTVFYQTTLPDQNDLAISLISTLDSEGKPGWDAGQQKPLFRGYLVFYRDSGNNTLRTFRVDIAPTSVAVPLTEAEVRSRIGVVPSQSLATLVSTFQLFSPTDSSVLSTWANPLGLRLVQQTSRGTPVTTEIPFKFLSL